MARSHYHLSWFCTAQDHWQAASQALSPMPCRLLRCIDQIKFDAFITTCNLFYYRANKGKCNAKHYNIYNYIIYYNTRIYLHSNIQNIYLCINVIYPQNGWRPGNMNPRIWPTEFNSDKVCTMLILQTRTKNLPYYMLRGRRNA